MKALTHADSAITCVISVVGIRSLRPVTKRFLAELQSAAKLLTEDWARRIAVNIAKLPDLLRRLEARTVI
jgi:hypothetical protein